MTVEPQMYEYIDEQEDLIQFYESNSAVEWMCFDTEFVGEKRFVTRLCLIQVATINGNYLIDPFSIGNLDPFIKLIVDPAITKITHAGENDYRLLFNQLNITPENIFDTQLAAGFVGYRYPISFRKLVEQELGLFLKKG